MNKNDIMINLNTSIIGDNLNIEKLKVQQKLVEYRKLIDMKIDELAKNKKRKIFKKKKIYNSCEKEDKIYYSDKKKYKKILEYNSNSDFEGYSNKKDNNKFSNTNYKKINNEHLRNIHNINFLNQNKSNYCGKRIINSQLKNSNSLNRSDSNKKGKIYKEKGRIYLDSYNEVMNKKNFFY